MLPIFLASIALLSKPDILVADFERADYGGWAVTGQAFGSGPAHGTLPGQMSVTGYLGKGLANSFHGGDNSTGTLTSPLFVVKRSYVNFLIGGGKKEGTACVNLLIDGRVVRTATGPNDRPGGTEALAWRFWDVREWLGKPARIEIVDHATGGWGHINVDQIVQSDTKKETPPMERVIAIHQCYLLLPVKTGAPKVRVRYDVDGHWTREFSIELAPEKPDFWAFSDVSAFAGKDVKVSVSGFAGPNPLAALKQSDEVPGAKTLYREALRPQFHFSSRVGWLNDPNGLVYHDGEYHLFYQHNPFGWGWDNMHWGHAVSPDLVHWTELPIAIYPHQWDDWVYSGSAIIDTSYTSGFGTPDHEAMVAAYTSTGRGECIAYSTDNGRTFKEYAGNPVIKHEGRDPKLIWYAPGQHWVMALYDESEGKRWIQFYTSNDLRNWSYQSRIEGFYECPELFEIPVSGQQGATRWIAYEADGQYLIGGFDGKTFAPESGKHPLSFGDAFYASQTFNGMPDGRRVQIGWGRSETPGMPFNQCMLFPSELTLRSTTDGLRLFVNPAKEIEKLYATPSIKGEVTLGDEPKTLIDGELLDIRADLEFGDAKQIGLVVAGSPLTYSVDTHELEFRGCRAPLLPEAGKVRLRLLIDRTTVEIYCNDGSVYMPVSGINVGKPRVLAFAHGGVGTISYEIHELASAWPSLPGRGVRAALARPH